MQAEQLLITRGEIPLRNPKMWESCDLCKPVRLLQDVFVQLKHLPFPVPGKHGHYLPFLDVFGAETSEEQRKSRSKSLPFYASIPHVKNAQLMLSVKNVTCGD